MLTPCACVEKLNTRVVNHTCKKSNINLRVYPLTTTLIKCVVAATPEVFRLQPSECGSSLHQSAILAHEVLYFIQVHFGTLQVLKLVLHILELSISLSQHPIRYNCYLLHIKPELSELFHLTALS